MKNAYLLSALLFFSMAGLTPLQAQVTPGRGDLLITEIMANPDAVSDSNGEWFEIRNMTGHDILLNGVTLADAGSNQHVMAAENSLIIPPYGYWVLARNGDSLVNGGIRADYAYQNFTLGNSSDQVFLTAADGTLIDQVSYGEGWPIVAGASMELDPGYTGFGDNDLADNWFPAKTPFGMGDMGSPGRANPGISGIHAMGAGFRIELFPNPAHGRFVLEASFDHPQSGLIRMINLLGQEFTVGKFNDRSLIREILEPAFLTPGIWFLEVTTGERTNTVRLLVEE